MYTGASILRFLLSRTFGVKRGHEDAGVCTGTPEYGSWVLQGGGKGKGKPFPFGEMWVIMGAKHLNAVTPSKKGSADF